MERKVMTVCGEITADEIGCCLIHEHIGFGYPGWQTVPRGFDREECIRTAVHDLRKAKEYGISTVIEATPADCGRDPLLYREISEKAEVNIICTAGCYSESEGAAAYYRYRMSLGKGEDEVYEMLAQELENGIGETGIRPGVIKTATGKDCISEYETMFIKAAAKAAVNYDVNIITHTQAGTMGAAQAKMLIENGVKPEHIMIGHLNNYSDIKGLIDIFDQGVYGGFDRWGLGDRWLGPEKYQIAALMSVIGSGYGNRIMFSHDHDCYGRGYFGDYSEKRHTASPNDWTYISTHVLPLLHSLGVSEEQTDMIMHENPAGFFR